MAVENYLMSLPLVTRCLLFCEVECFYEFKANEYMTVQ